MATTWKLKDLRDGKDYLYIMELEGNVLTKRYGWDGGKLRKSTRSYDNADLARTDAEKAVNKKILEGYELMDEPQDTGTVDEPPVPETPAVTDDLFPIERIMKVRDARIKHPVLICALTSGYRFKVFPDQEFGKDVVGKKAKLSYDTTDAYGAPVNPTLVEVIDE